MIVIGRNEINRFIYNNRDLLLLVYNHRIVWGQYILITPSELKFSIAGEVKKYNVLSVGKWQVEELFASDASKSLLENK